MNAKWLRSLALVGTMIITSTLLLNCSPRTIKSGQGGDGTLGDAGDESSSGLYDGALSDRDGSKNPENADWAPLAVYTVYFDYDSYAITGNERNKLENLSKWLADNPGEVILLAGHTDSRGTTQYNLSLGERRSLAVRDYLIGLNVNSRQLQTLSYGEERPASTGEGESAWAKNRRVQMGILK